MAQVRTGIDRLRDDGFAPLKGKRFALLAHAGSTDSSLAHSFDLLATSSVGTFVRAFGPEHGLTGSAEYMVGVSTSTDARTGIPVVSLYDGTYESLAPKEKDLQDVDVLVVDLPDVGARYYTYAQTMALAMRVCGKLGVKVLVCDRPNPIDGITIEGAPLLGSCRSFCGYTPIPNRHGLTLGELAKLYQAGYGEGADRQDPIPCDLEILTVEGWQRSQYFLETKLPWILPSPNIPTVESAIIYPGGCLFEGTNISEGRGTTKPFEFVGAPFLNGHAWREATHAQGINLEGAILRPISFLPKFDKWAGKECHGVQIHITDNAAFQPFRWALALIAAAKQLAPSQFAWRTDPYEFVADVPAIDLLYGSPRFRQQVDHGGSLRDLLPELDRCKQKFVQERQQFLLYP